MNVSDALSATRAAMGRGQQRPDADEAPTEPGGCQAYGCPCRGTVDLGTTGRATCSWHAWAAPQRWGELTNQLRQHQWLLDFIGELAVVQRRGRHGAWVLKARDFFAADPACQPTNDEATRFNLYVWRLREELSWRIGLRPERPEPRSPMQVERKAAARVIESARAGADVSTAQITAALQASGDLEPPDFSDIPWPDESPARARVFDAEGAAS